MLPDARERRLAENEAIFRLANERMASWAERHADEESELYVCECATTSCSEHLELTRAAYEGVRENPRRFLVFPGHEITDVESVVERHDGWLVVEKNPETHAIAEATDLRSD